MAFDVVWWNLDIVDAGAPILLASMEMWFSSKLLHYA